MRSSTPNTRYLIPFPSVATYARSESKPMTSASTRRPAGTFSS